MDEFTPTQIETIYQVIAARRDVRHFRSDPLDEALIARLLQAAHCAPNQREQHVFGRRHTGS